MDDDGLGAQRAERFGALYDAAYVDLLRFASRRMPPALAEDLVAEVMLVGWRRLDDVPDELSQARAWLFGVARNILADARRKQSRRDALAVRLAETATAPFADTHPDAVALRVDVHAGWQRLSAAEQETLALTLLDGLTAPEAASVLGISPTAYRIRLSRARRSLRRHVEAADPSARGTAATTGARS